MKILPYFHAMLLSTKPLVALFLLFLSPVLWAQKITISTPSKLTSDIERVKIIGKNTDGYVVRFSGGEEVFQLYSPDLKLTGAKTFDFEKTDGFVQYVQLYKTGGVVYYLHSERDYTTIMAQWVNSKFQKMGSPMVLDTVRESIEITNANLRMQVAANQKYMVFYIPEFNGKQILAMKMTVVNCNLQPIFKTKIVINKAEREMEYVKTLIDTAGNCGLIVNDNKLQYDVYWIDKNNPTTATRYKVKYGKKIFGDPYFEIDNKNNSLLFGGFYDNQDGVGDPAAYGVFYLRYNAATGNLLAADATALPDTFMRALTGRDVSVTNNRLYTFQLRKVIQRTDGGLAFLAESYIRDVRQEQSIALSVITPYNNVRTVNTFQYNDIIAFGVDAAGKLVWNNILRKKQYSEEDNGFYSSFFMMNRKDELHFVYSDETDMGADVDEYVLHSDGTAQKRLIFNKSDKDIQIVAKQGKQTAADEAIIPSIKRGIFKLVRIKY